MSNDTQVLTLTDFLLARIAEDEEVARATLASHDPLKWDPNEPSIMGPVDGPSGYESVVVDPARVLAECEAKRRIVEEATVWGCQKTMSRLLALPYADHPTYREEWKP